MRILFAVVVFAALSLSACHRNPQSVTAVPTPAPTPEPKRPDIRVTFTDTTEATLKQLLDNVSHLKNMGLYQRWVLPQGTMGKWHCSTVVKITNKGGAAGPYDPRNLRLTVKHQVFEPVSFPMDGSLPFGTATLQPGQTVSGCVFFLMPSGSLDAVKHGEADIGFE